VKVCTLIMKWLVDRGFTNQVHEKEVEKAIIFVRGPDKRTLQNWKRALVSLEFLEKESLHVYRMNLLKVPELLTSAIHNDRKQKKLM